MACAALCATAQDDLTKEITVETDYTPTERLAAKLNALPAVSRPEATAAQITYSDWAVPAEVPATAPLMMPYGYLTTRDYPRWRGHLDASISTRLNLRGNFGYRLIDTDATELALWLRHNSNWTGRNKSDYLPAGLDDAQKQKYNDNTIGFNLSHTVYKGTLTASAFYHCDNFNYYGGYSLADSVYSTSLWDTGDYKQTVNEAGASIGWESRKRNRTSHYSISLAYNYFAFSKGLLQNSGNKGNSDNHLTATFNAQAISTEATAIGIDASIDYLSRSWQGIDGDSTATASTKNLGMLTLAPYLRYASDGVNARVGAVVNISLSDGATLRLAPRIDASMALADRVFLYLDATGGKRLTTLREIYHSNRYINPCSQLSSSYSPLDGEVGFKIGPFKGFHAKVYCGYGIFKDMAMPSLSAEEPVTHSTTYAATDLKGVKVGAEVGYNHGKAAQLTIKATFAPQDGDDGYFLGHDRAQFTGDIIAAVTPADRLTVDASCQLRCRRRVYSPDDGTCADLGDVTRLNLGAKYRLSETLTLFAQGYNLFNSKWDTAYGMSDWPIGLLAGFSLLF